MAIVTVFCHTAFQLRDLDTQFFHLLFHGQQFCDHCMQQGIFFPKEPIFFA
ncbi:MAG: hypothetical protein NVSMB49_22180 [Ktedonobacteraceae bacterium]